MSATDTFRVNSPRVIYENIDGELVLINLEKGSYYSTDSVGAELWDLIVAGCCVTEMHQAIRARYEGDALEIDKAIAEFLSELRGEELIIAAEEAGKSERARPGAGAERRPFLVPVLNKYSDMKDMLVLDPIHDVEERGWPARRAIENPPSPAPKPAE